MMSFWSQHLSRSKSKVDDENNFPNCGSQNQSKQQTIHHDNRAIENY
jgi:hypothetical protein